MSFHPDVHTVRVREFTAKSVAEFSRRFSALIEHGQPAVPIIIDSYGGDSYACLAMVDIIEDAKANGLTVPTIALGKAMSCGGILFAVGSRGHRYVAPNACVMVHDVQSKTVGKTQDVEMEAGEMRRLSDIVFGILDKAAKKRSGYFDKLCAKNGRADLILSAEQAVEHGLADEVRIPTFKGVANVVVL